jgi:hypothetical protein
MCGVFDVTPFRSNVDSFPVEFLLIKVMDNIFVVCKAKCVPIVLSEAITRQLAALWEEGSWALVEARDW